MVGRYSGRGVRLRFRRVPDVGNTQVNVSALKRLQVRLPIGQRVRIKKRISEDRVAVRVVLLKRSSLANGAARRRNLRLVERQGNYGMTPQVADVADLDREIVPRLPLNIQRLVHGVRKLVRAVVVREREQRNSG